MLARISLATGFALAACHTPAATPVSAPRVIAPVAEAPREHAPGRVDLSEPMQAPLAEMIATGHEVCGDAPPTPRGPIDDTPPARNGRLLLAHAIRVCPPVQRPMRRVYGLH